MYKNNKGITLITLVVTIIVLMILAGIVVSSLTQEDKNIVDKSKEVRESTEIAQEQEILKNILIEVQNRVFTGANETEITNAKISYINDALINEGIIDAEVSTSSVKIKTRTYNYSDLIPGFSNL